MPHLLWLEIIFVAAAVSLFFFVVEGFSFLGFSPQALEALAIVSIVFAVMGAFLLYKAIQATRLKVKTGRESFFGATGVAVSDLKPKGEVRVMSEFWQAKAINGWIREGEEVKVTDMQGLFLIVKPAKEKV